MSKYLALDLGAESGRAVVGLFEDSRLRLEEVHRFPNGPVQVLDSLHWDVLRLWSEVKHGLELAVQAHGDDIASIGLDTWGVDFGLLAPDDTLLGAPYHYRDSRTDGMMAAAFKIIPQEVIYERTGIQFMQLNSLFQLLAMVRDDSSALKTAGTFLTMPDLFNFWLSGRKANEFTISTTTQCYDPRARDWAWEMLESLGIPTTIFGQIVPAGTILGPLHSSVARETGSRPIPVVAPATHDTASAVAAIPATASDYIFLSSGTWSLMGVEVDEPVISKDALAFNFTNEGSYNSTFRFLRNIMGLWLVQECRRVWSRIERDYSYDELTELAAASPAFGPLVVPGDTRFLPPGDMPSRIQAFCQETGQAVPQTKGEIIRCALESLAMEYRLVADRLESVVGRRLPTIHIFGGGSKNTLLNQYTADSTGRTVISGPVEATSLGNILVQALALGQLRSLDEGRAAVRDSFATRTFVPTEADRWEAAYQRYLALNERVLS